MKYLFVSDLHLEADSPRSVAAFTALLRGEARSAAALYVLGDLFEAWVGDDAIDTPGFAADCAQVLREASAQRPLFFLHGNRDFLLGSQLLAHCQGQLLDDPCVLTVGKQRWLLAHGDALCLDDVRYMAFRAQVRSAFPRKKRSIEFCQ